MRNFSHNAVRRQRFQRPGWRRSIALLLCSSAVMLPMLSTGHTSAGGGLDPGFGDGGIVITNLTGSDFSFAIALQPDGKILTAGTSRFGFTLVRYNPDGTLDQTFGSSGSVLQYFGPYNLAYGLAIQSDGKILAAGYEQNGVAAGPGFTVTPLVARYNSDGTPDSSFGDQGVAAVNQGVVESARAVAIQQDGKIVLAGNRMISPNIMRGPSKFALSRVDSDGRLDQTFGASGKTTTSFSEVDFLSTILIQPDGKIIAVGDSGETDSGESEGRSVAIARYNTDGSLDREFGTGGRIVTSMPEGAAGYAAVLQPDGKIIVTGSAGDHLLLARYNSDGSLDSTFGTGGLISSISGEGYSVVVDAEGRIVVGGSAAGETGDDFAILRFNPDGSPDASFGTDGVATMDLGFSETGRALAIDAAGRIIMSGYLQKDPSSSDGTRLGLLAYQPASTSRCMRGAAGEYVVFSPEGQYKFTLCGKQEMTMAGAGTVSTDGSTLTILDRQPDRVVKIVFDIATSTGKAKIKMVMPEGIMPFTIKSTNPNAVCSCSAR